MHRTLKRIRSKSVILQHLKPVPLESKALQVYIYICITMFIEVRGGLRCRIDLMVGMTVGFKARNIENVLHCSSERVTL